MYICKQLDLDEKQWQHADGLFEIFESNKNPPREEMLARVDARRGDASDADARVVERQLDYNLGELSGWHRVSSAGSPSEMLERALRLI